MRQRIYNFYVLSHRFDGHGRGFAVGFDSEKAAHVFANYCLFGWAYVQADWQVERNFPEWYQSRVTGA